MIISFTAEIGLRNFKLDVSDVELSMLSNVYNVNSAVSGSSANANLSDTENDVFNLCIEDDASVSSNKLCNDA